MSPRAVLRVKSISLRDYSGTVIFEEEKTRLYYAIRVLQDYLKKGRVVISELTKLPLEVQDLIEGDEETVKRLYQSAEYTIVDQYRRRPFDSLLWRDLLELIKLGHYDLTQEQIKEALDEYNRQTNLKTYQSIEEVERGMGEGAQRRFAERLMYMKPSAWELQQRSYAGVAI